MKHIILFISVAVVLFLTGCGHNLGTVVHGKFVNIGYDPEINKIGIQYVDGVMATGLQKELSETTLSFTDSVEKDGVKTSTTVDYTSKNGAQVTGYQVDAIRAANESKE